MHVDAPGMSILSSSTSPSTESSVVVHGSCDRRGLENACDVFNRILECRRGKPHHRDLHHLDLQSRTQNDGLNVNVKGVWAFFWVLWRSRQGSADATWKLLGAPTTPGGSA